MRDIIIAIIFLATVWLAYACYQNDKNDEISYPDSSIKKLNKMSGKALGISALSLERRQQIMSIYQLSEQDIAQPTDIFNEGK